MPFTLVVCATVAERDAAARLLDVSHSSVDLVHARAAAGNVDLLVGGVGAAAAAAATSAALAFSDYDLVVCAGIAGGFGSVALGATVVATAVVKPISVRRTGAGFLPLSALGLGCERHELDPAVVASLIARTGALADAVRGAVLTVSTVTGSAATAAARLARCPDAVAEAMEGAGVLAAAQRHGVAFAEVRTISNTVGPRDRDAWRIGPALAALGTAVAAITAAPLAVTRLTSAEILVMTALSLAFSPCPNDTFVFDAWVNGRLNGRLGDRLDAPSVEVTYADVDVTNTAALDDVYDVVKVSYAALPWLLDRYELLPCGGALGRGCGPLVLTRGDRGDLDGARVAVPGERTTAYLLMRLWAAGQHPATIDVVPFAEIMPAVRAGRYDAGLVIHEARFTYHEYELSALADLGEWWEHDTGLPIPLGAILARRDLAARTGVTAAQVTDVIRASVRYAWAHPDASAAYVAALAQEMDPDVQRRHIDLYVNEFTEALGQDGYGAIEALLTRAHAAGLVPPTPPLR